MPSGSTSVGSPKVRFIDAWLVRGTYHVEGGLLKEASLSSPANPFGFVRFLFSFVLRPYAQSTTGTCVPTKPS